jgi:hypothetical protein
MYESYARCSLRNEAIVNGKSEMGASRRIRRGASLSTYIARDTGLVAGHSPYNHYDLGTPSHFQKPGTMG